LGTAASHLPINWAKRAYVSRSRAALGVVSARTQDEGCVHLFQTNKGGRQMSKATTVLAILGLASAMAFAGPALAQETGFFVGGSIGQSDTDEEITSGFIDSGTVDSKDTAYKIFGGYMFNRHLGVELAYINFGEVTYSGTAGGFAVTDGTVELTAFNLAALGVFPINEQFSVFGKVGLFKWEAEASDTLEGIPFSAEDDGTDVSFGVGVAYNVTRNFGVRAEYELFKGDHADTSLISIGAVWRF
jgi:OmpA-OmpF porin, OOP family